MQSQIKYCQQVTSNGVMSFAIRLFRNNSGILSVSVSDTTATTKKADATHSLSQKNNSTVRLEELLIIFPCSKCFASASHSYKRIQVSCTHRSSLIQTLLSVLESHQINPKARGLYRRWGIAPRPEELFPFQVYIAFTMKSRISFLYLKIRVTVQP